MLVYQRVNVLIIVDHCGSVIFKHCLKMFLSVWVMFKWKMDHVKHQLYSHLHTVDCLLFLIVADNCYCLSPDFSCSIPHAPTSDLYCLYHLGCAPTYWTNAASFWCIVGHIYSIYTPFYPHDGFYYTDLYRIPHNFVGWGKIRMKYTLISVHLFLLKSHSPLYVFHFTSPQSGWLYRSCWSFIRLLFCVPCYIMLLLYRHTGDTRTSEDRTYRKTYNHSKIILLSLFLRFICCYLSIYMYIQLYTPHVYP